MKKGILTKRCQSFFLLLFFSVAVNNIFAGGTYYVAPNGTGKEDGTSWSDAMGNEKFATALINASSGDVFYLMSGVYKPVLDKDNNASVDSKLKTFLIKEGVTIYGSFKSVLSGTECDLENDREKLIDENGVFAPTTIFSGDFLNNDTYSVSGRVSSNNSENASTILTINAPNKSVKLSGITISNGKGGNGAGVFLASGELFLDHVQVSKNSGSLGAGIYVAKDADLTMEFSEITCNSNGASGAGLYVEDNCDITLTQVLFQENRGVEGAAIFLSKPNDASDGTRCSINQCTFDSNSVTVQGGTVISVHSVETITLAYSTFTNNERAAVGYSNIGAVYSAADNANIYHCTFMGNKGTKDYGSAVTLSQYGTTSKDVKFGGNVIIGNQEKEMFAPAGSNITSLGYNILNTNNTYKAAEDKTDVALADIQDKYCENVVLNGVILTPTLTKVKGGFTSVVMPKKEAPFSIVSEDVTRGWLAITKPTKVYDQQMLAMEPNNGNLFAGSVHLNLGIPLSIRVFLEGAFLEDGTMRNSIQVGFSEFTLPKDNPYLVSGVSYAKISDPSGPAGKIVDWIQVLIRDASNPGIEPASETRALLLNTDGYIVDTDGKTPTFKNHTGTVYIQVVHRNHLNVVSQPILMSAIDNKYDFTTALSKALSAGPDPMIKVNNVYCMWSGDLNQDGNIDSTDLIEVLKGTEPSRFEEYIVSDVTLDGYSDSSDLILVYKNSNENLYSPTTDW